MCNIKNERKIYHALEASWCLLTPQNIIAVGYEAITGRLNTDTASIFHKMCVKRRNTLRNVF